jgi:hypothetical protein
MAKTVNIWLDGKHLEVPDTMTIIETKMKYIFLGSVIILIYLQLLIAEFVW